MHCYLILHHTDNFYAAVISLMFHWMQSSYCVLMLVPDYIYVQWVRFKNSSVYCRCFVVGVMAFFYDRWQMDVLWHSG